MLNPRRWRSQVSEGGEDGPLEADAVATAADSETVAAKPKRRRSSTSRKLSPLANIQEEEAMAHNANAETGDPMDGGKQAPQPPSPPARRKARLAAIAAPNANADHDVTAAMAPPPVLPKPKRKPAATIDSDTAAAAPSVTAAIGEGANEVKAPERRAGPPHGIKRSPEHRAAIAAAIRRKWQDPAYRASAIAGIRRAAGSDAGVAVGEAARRRQAGNRAKLPGTGPGAGSSAASVGVGSRTEAGSHGATATKNNLDEEELPLTVRSSRTGRGGTRRGGTYNLEDGAVHSANSSSSTNDSRSGAAVGGDPHSGDSSDTATPASSGGRAAGGGPSHGVNPATRLAHVQRLVRQVLVAERLVANTENLLRQFTQRRHALRNDPVIRSQADEQLRSVTATLQQAKVKLELLRAKVPPDARYNEKGDVWFVPHVAGSLSGPQAFRPPRAAASAGSGSGNTAGSMGVGAAHVEEISDNGVLEDGVAGQRSSNSSTSSGGGGMAVSGSNWHGGFSWQENGRGKGLDESGTVVDVDGCVADTGAGAGQNGNMGAPEFWGSNANNGVGLGGNGAHSHRWQSDYEHHAYSINMESSSPGNGNNGTNGLKGPLNSNGLNGNAVPLDPYKELKYTDLDEEGEDEDEGEDDEDGFWWSSGGGHSPPSGRSPTGPGGLGTFADLPAFDPDEKIQVDLTSLDPLNTLLLRPVNGHASPHPGVTKRRSSNKSNSSTRAGLELEPPSNSSADSRVNDDAVGSDGTGDAAATVDPMHGADSNGKSSRRGGSLNAGLGSDWLAAHGDGGGGAAPSGLQLPGQLRSENARDLAAWLGDSQGRTLGELQALLPESHAWLKGLLTHHEVVITGSLHAAGQADAAKQEFDWLIRLQEHVAAGSRVGHGVLSPAANNSARVFGRRWSEAATSLCQDPSLKGVVCPMAGPKLNAESVGGNVDGAWMAGGKELGAGRRVAAEQRLQMQEEEVQEWDQRQQQHGGEQSTDQFVDAQGDVQASVARERRSRRGVRLRKT
ncbi:hypothetical protein Vretifemale_1315 [Volvox reticuliferus]|uniref:Uncharacterized protein n=1 Tax=Volvox reticuliferus TaxID=1737510 RepID=A0A8J4FG16_9CHLO|nr:hypothetical protein Vretifemale_1315 [Volvox reticuliferus]